MLARVCEEAVAKLEKPPGDQTGSCFGALALLPIFPVLETAHPLARPLRCVQKRRRVQLPAPVDYPTEIDQNLLKMQPGRATSDREGRPQTVGEGPGLDPRVSREKRQVEIERDLCGCETEATQLYPQIRAGASAVVGREGHETDDRAGSTSGLV